MIVIRSRQVSPSHLFLPAALSYFVRSVGSTGRFDLLFQSIELEMASTAREILKSIPFSFKATFTPQVDPINTAAYDRKVNFHFLKIHISLSWKVSHIIRSKIMKSVKVECSQPTLVVTGDNLKWWQRWVDDFLVLFCFYLKMSGIYFPDDRPVEWNAETVRSSISDSRSLQLASRLGRRLQSRLVSRLERPLELGRRWRPESGTFRSRLSNLIIYLIYPLPGGG